MKVQVTEEDIAKGVPLKIHKCPVARAIARVVGKEVRVANLSYSFDGSEFPLPSVAIDFIADFDIGRPVQPFEFELP